jgi:PPE-repeat protein
MDFSVLSPEINSARIYSGPGTGPLLAAATAWKQLAGDLNSSAAAYRSVIAGLTTDGWRGPSSMMMAGAAAPYVGWLHSTAAQAEQSAVQAKTASAAYQTAFSMTVPPPLIAANRARLSALIASNFFGQNSPAIAATEADYERMWAQDAAAMYGYAASASTASKLAPFTDPPAMVSQSTLPETTSAAQALAAPAQAMETPSLLTYLLQIPSITSAAASTSSSSFSGASIGTTNNAIAVNAERDEAQGIGPFLAGSAGPLPAMGNPGPAGAATVAGPGVSAVTGRASLVGTLSVPQSWAATVTPSASPAAAVAPATSAVGAPTTTAALPPGMFGETMLGTLAGRGVSNAAAKLRRPSVIPRSPAAG